MTDGSSRAAGNTIDAFTTHAGSTHAGRRRFLQLAAAGLGGAWFFGPVASRAAPVRTSARIVIAGC